jgi:Ca-activated chloride channel family protein
LRRDLEARHGAPLRGSTQAHRKADRSFTQVASGRSPDLVELGQRYGLLSSATSYVAIEERSAADKTTTPAVLRKVPIAITQGWHGRGSVLSPGAHALQGNFGSAAPAATVSGTIQAMYGPRPAGEPSAARFGRLSETGRTSQRPPAGATASAQGFGRPVPHPPDTALPLPAADRLFDLLMTQQADGSFRLSTVLQDWLGQRYQAVRVAAAQHGDALVATAVVIKLLAQEAADRADEWGPAAAKAQRWLAQQGRHVEVEAWL